MLAILIDQDSVNYMLVQPSKNEENSLQAEIDPTDFKQSNLVWKKKEKTVKKNVIYF